MFPPKHNMTINAPPCNHHPYHSFRSARLAFRHASRFPAHVRCDRIRSTRRTDKRRRRQTVPATPSGSSCQIRCRSRLLQTISNGINTNLNPQPRIQAYLIDTNHTPEGNKSPLTSSFLFLCTIQLPKTEIKNSAKFDRKFCIFFFTTRLHNFDS